MIDTANRLMSLLRQGNKNQLLDEAAKVNWTKREQLFNTIGEQFGFTNETRQLVSLIDACPLPPRNVFDREGYYKALNKFYN